MSGNDSGDSDNTVAPGWSGSTGFWPADERQATRMRRILTAWLASLLVAALMVLAHLAGMLGGPDTLLLVGVMGLACPLFMLAVRLRWNVRLADPSLTRVMIGAGSGAVLYAAWAAQHSRPLVYLPILVVVLFGVFRLSLRELRALAVALTAAYAAVAFARGDALLATVTATAAYAYTLFWLTLLGGRVGELRRRLAEANRQLTEALAHARSLSTHDDLTSLLNRRGAFDHLRAERARSDRQSQPFCVAIIDLDHFKLVNDAHGHAAGDAVLRAFATLASDTLRPADSVARFGGEEFLLVVSQTGATGTLILAERLRQRVLAQVLSDVPGGLRYTFSCGIACYRPGESLDRLLARADAALYRAKQGGRNRIEMEEPEPDAEASSAPTETV